ncbi:MAG: heparan-alpha-glucosaminide N-acetyltransferase domain-containing protein [Gemmataceae bacterium]
MSPGATTPTTTFEGDGPPAAGAPRRDDPVDLLRGIAVVTMIAANLSAKALREPHPFWLRIYGSFAAPLFVLLAGMMIVHARRVRGRGLLYVARRGLQLIAAGVLIDVAFERIYPFTSMDVLYLIGVALPLGYLCLRLPGAVRWGLALAVFAAAPLLQDRLGYSEYPTEYELDGELVEESADSPVKTSIAAHVFFDGWFPLLPWFGFALVGLNLADWRWKQGRPRSFATLLVLAASLLFLGAGGALGWFFPGPLLTRGGYSELFYPPRAWYLVTACGVILLLFCAVDCLPPLKSLDPLRVLGQHAFFVYILHRGIIALVIPERAGRNRMPAFLLTYAALLAVCILSAYALRWGRTLLRKINAER